MSKDMLPSSLLATPSLPNLFTLSVLPFPDAMYLLFCSDHDGGGSSIFRHEVEICGGENTGALASSAHCTATSSAGMRNSELLPSAIFDAHYSDEYQDVALRVILRSRWMCFDGLVAERLRKGSSA
uniref:Uncharacterized protein n=1 Tax=Mycena chlorophos TaxID=658473 RepID=A0ABQ0MAP6_MYCCL|nr:predicted protein [Mycena chlorophos]